MGVSKILESMITTPKSITFTYFKHKLDGQIKIHHPQKQNIYCVWNKSIEVVQKFYTGSNNIY